jgi:6-phosphofructokinase 1
VKAVVERVGYCVVVASEGIATADGRFVADAGGGKDSFGHSQLGGVAAHLAGRVKDQLGLKVHWALPDYLQRSAATWPAGPTGSRRRRSARPRCSWR